MEFSEYFTSLLNNRSSSKFMATLDTAQTPNIIPVFSLESWDRSTAIFGEYLMWKSKRNLQTVPRAGLLAVLDRTQCGMAICDFDGFEESGQYMEALQKNSIPVCSNSADWQGYRNAGRLNYVKSWTMTLTNGSKYLKKLIQLRLCHSRSSKAATAMPISVFRRLNKSDSIKTLAFVGGDGYPLAFPAFPMIAPDRRTILFSLSHLPTRPADGQSVAVCVLSADNVAYQLKGKFHPLRNSRGLIEISEVFTACPPLCGEKIGG
ncbi:MAG TPA: hypothetical protein DCY85_06870 [Firmicutes bacterium]|nr:hypothetical protein [Bacillota bacterium]HAW70940.1 hypothetical protein [Bacillota bacterium]HAZ22478.1 hypothetical protein [Bacillota bacterium]HBE06197.1 hypothetical protein [Bacillota bacterium]HBL50644.1 hypothetical protein [Bacillota bacterium]